MIDPGQFRDEVIVPTLEFLGVNSEAATRLLLGTALVESGLVYLRQHRGGPALGFYQIEPATHNWLMGQWLTRRSSSFRESMLLLRAAVGNPLEQLQTNLAYATAVARCKYLSVPAPLPAAHDIQALGQYWKLYYNTRAGDGDAADFVRYLGRVR